MKEYFNKRLKELGLELKEEDTKKERVVITIEGDLNDADYSTKITELFITNEKSVDIIIKVIKLIQRYQDKLMYEHGVEDASVNKWFTELTGIVDIPSDDFGYCHTITDINVMYITNKGKQYRII